jgi:hypothetical protein
MKGFKAWWVAAVVVSGGVAGCNEFCDGPSHVREGFASSAKLSTGMSACLGHTGECHVLCEEVFRVAPGEIDHCEITSVVYNDRRVVRSATAADLPQVSGVRVRMTYTERVLCSADDGDGTVIDDGFGGGFDGDLGDPGDDGGIDGGGDTDDGGGGIDDGGDDGGGDGGDGGGDGGGGDGGGGDGGFHATPTPTPTSSLLSGRIR